MKKLLLPVIAGVCCLAWTINAKPHPPKRCTVSGTLLLQHDFCNGTHTDVQHTYAAAGTTLYVRKAGTATVLDSIVCDSTGKFNVQLAAGDYCFIEQWKRDPIVMPVNTTYETWDTACYRSEYNTCDFHLHVSKSKNDVAIVLTRHCASTRPCCTFRGPTVPVTVPVNRGGYQPGHQE